MCGSKGRNKSETHVNLAVVADDAVDALLNSSGIAHVNAVKRSSDAEVVVELLNGSCEKAGRSIRHRILK